MMFEWETVFPVGLCSAVGMQIGQNQVKKLVGSNSNTIITQNKCCFCSKASANN